jgi:dihydroorotase
LTTLANARLLDPATGYDGPGLLRVEDGVIVEVRHGPGLQPPEGPVVDCAGRALMPGLIDLRAKGGGGLDALAAEAAAGGVTTAVVIPESDHPTDEPSAVAGLLARGRALSGARLLPAGALTRGLGGERMAEIGLMRETGAVLFSDGDHALADTRLLRRILTYAAAFGALVAHRPLDPHLARGAVARESEQAGRLGLPSVPAAAERIGVERDAALVELTGAPLLVDGLGTEAGVEALARAKARGLPLSGASPSTTWPSTRSTRAGWTRASAWTRRWDRVGPPGAGRRPL